MQKLRERTNQHNRNGRVQDQTIPHTYREIDARFASEGTCGHAIGNGDRIGWHAGLKKTQCADCWRRWVAENAEAEAMERGCL